jgi:hypothetical protein
MKSGKRSLMIFGVISVKLWAEIGNVLGELRLSFREVLSWE